MGLDIDAVLAGLPDDPVFVCCNHHPEGFVEALAAAPVDEGTAVFFPIGSVRDHGRAIRALAGSPGWRVLTTFVSPPIVDAVAEGAVEYVPVRTSSHAEFVRRRFGDRYTVLVGHVPPPVDGDYTFGIASPHAPLLFDHVDTTVAVTNDALPVVRGPTLRADDWDVTLSTDEPLPTVQPSGADHYDTIGANVASLVPDDATIQLGIGSIPGAVTAALEEKAALTVHSGVISDGVLDLVDAGALDLDADTPVLTSLVLGESREFYDRVEGYDAVELGSALRVHDPVAAGRNDRFVAVNSAIEVDLAGQVNASHIGPKQYAAPGGIEDFVESAHGSREGKSIIAMEARAKPDVPKVVPSLGDGAPVDVPRTNVDYVVTEYGVATLVDRTPRERAAELVQVAHPDDRDALAAAAEAQRP